MAILSLLRDTGSNASTMSIVRMVTDATLEEIVQPGWIGTQQIFSYDSNPNPDAFQWRIDDVVLVRFVTHADFVPYTSQWFWIVPDFKSLIPFLIMYPNTQGLTAHAGGGQVNATQLNPGTNVVTTVAVNNDSTILPFDALDQTVIVANRTIHTLAVFPAVGDSINELAINTEVTIAPGRTRMFIGVSTNNWQVYH